MSTDYELRCIDHGDSFGIDNWRTPEQVEHLRHLLHHFAQIGSHCKGLWLWGWEGRDSMFPSLFHWAAAHHGCHVRVFDEYGRDWSRRDEVCECGHTYHDHFSHGSELQTCVVRADSEKRCEPHLFKRAA